MKHKAKQFKARYRAFKARSSQPKIAKEKRVIWWRRWWRAITAAAKETPSLR